MTKDRPTNLPIVGNPQNTPQYDKRFLYYKIGERITIQTMLRNGNKEVGKKLL